MLEPKTCTETRTQLAAAHVFVGDVTTEIVIVMGFFQKAVRSVANTGHGPLTPSLQLQLRTTFFSTYGTYDILIIFAHRDMS